MWMIHRIHHDAAHMWPSDRASGCGPPCRARYFHDPGYRPDRLSRRSESRILRISREGILTEAYSPSRATSRTDDPALRAICPPLPGRNSTLWICVPSGMFLSGRQLPGRMSTLSPAMIGIADLDARWLQDVPLLTVCIGDECDPRRAVRVVLNRRHLARDVLLVPLEVDDAIEPLVPAAAPPGRQMSLDCYGHLSDSASRSADGTARSS